MTLTRNDLNIVDENVETILKHPITIVETPWGDRFGVMLQEYGPFEEMVSFLEERVGPLTSDRLAEARKIYDEETGGVQEATEVYRLSSLNGLWLESLHGNPAFSDMDDEQLDSMAQLGIMLGFEEVSPFVQIHHQSVSDAIDALVEKLNV